MRLAGLDLLSRLRGERRVVLHDEDALVALIQLQQGGAQIGAIYQNMSAAEQAHRERVLDLRPRKCLQVIGDSFDIGIIWPLLAGGGNPVGDPAFAIGALDDREHSDRVIVLAWSERVERPLAGQQQLIEEGLGEVSADQRIPERKLLFTRKLDPRHWCAPALVTLAPALVTLKDRALPALRQQRHDR